MHLSCAIFCFLCSVSFHWFNALSDKMNSLLARLDYSGIAILIAGSTYSPILYGFACTPRK